MGNALRSTGVRNCSAMECCMTLSIPCAIRLHSASRPHVGHSPSTGVYIRDRNSSGWTGTHDSFRAGRSENLTNPMIPFFTLLTLKHNKKNHKLQISVNWSLLEKNRILYRNEFLRFWSTGSMSQGLSLSVSPLSQLQGKQRYKGPHHHRVMSTKSHSYNSTCPCKPQYQNIKH